MNAQSAHSQRGPPTAVGAEVESHILLRNGLKGRKCQVEGPLGCRDRQDGWAGPLHEQVSQAAAEDIRYPQEQVQGAWRAGRKEARLRGIFCQPAPKYLRSGVGTWPITGHQPFRPW